MQKVNYLTSREITCIREVAEQYCLSPSETALLLDRINDTVCNRTQDAYFRAHAGAAAIERARGQLRAPLAGDMLASEARERLLGLALEDLELSNRSLWHLNLSGLQTVEELTRMSVDDLKRVPGIGSRSIREIKEVLESVGLSLREETGK